MRTLLLTTLSILAVCATAEAQRLRIDVVYTGGQILSGPLSADLTELPPSVNALFVLNGTTAGTYATADVLRSSLVFGDAAWNAADIVEFSATLMPADAGLAVTALTYNYAAKDTPTVDGRITFNFPLDIEGTDIASGQAFHYRYDTSSQTVTQVPEPSGVALSLIAAASAVALNRRHRRHPR